MVERVGVCWGEGEGGGREVIVAVKSVKSAPGMGKEVGGNCLQGFVWGLGLISGQ